ncbi:unnamed protein product [Calicophoron daubneyi]|uniref:Uncharacterized protein n=1 Tax=Calicophoron daubneyi TaxID=300641 RepID=A0AAV2TV84_CALDB
MWFGFSFKNYCEFKVNSMFYSPHYGNLISWDFLVWHLVGLPLGDLSFILCAIFHNSPFSFFRESIKLLSFVHNSDLDSQTFAEIVKAVRTYFCAVIFNQ